MTEVGHWTRLEHYCLSVYTLIHFDILINYNLNWHILKSISKLGKTVKNPIHRTFNMKTFITLLLVIGAAAYEARTKRNFTMAEIICMRSSLTCQVNCCKLLSIYCGGICCKVTTNLTYKFQHSKFYSASNRRRELNGKGGGEWFISMFDLAEPQRFVR